MLRERSTSDFMEMTPRYVERNIAKLTPGKVVIIGETEYFGACNSGKGVPLLRYPVEKSQPHRTFEFPVLINGSEQLVDCSWFVQPKSPQEEPITVYGKS